MIVGITLDALKPRLFLILFEILCLFDVWFSPKIWRGLLSVFGRVFGFRKRKEERVEGSSEKGLYLARPGDWQIEHPVDGFLSYSPGVFRRVLEID